MYSIYHQSKSTFRLAFTEDGSHGAFLVGPYEFKLFAIDKEDDDLITIKDVHNIECPKKYKQVKYFILHI